MRLPWPLGRQHTTDRAPEPPAVFARPRGAQAWRDLPVLTRSVGEPPLIAPTPPFRSDLAGAARAPIALAPLTHGHGLDAPAGIARNVVTAITPRSDAPAADRQARTALMAPGRRGRPEQALEIGDATDAPPVAPAPAPAASAAPAAAPADVQPATARRTPVGGASNGTPASLVRADRQPALPQTPVGRIGAARPVAAVQRAPASIPPAPETAAPAPKSAIKPETVAPVTPSAERLTLGQSRRLGLGAPIEPGALSGMRHEAAADSSPADLSGVTPLVLAAHPSNAFVPALSAPEPATSATSEASTGASGQSPTNVAASAPSVQTVGAPSAPTLAAPIRQRPARSPAVAQPSTPLVGARQMQPRIQRAPVAAPATQVMPAARAVPGMPRAPRSAGVEPSRAELGSEPVRIHRGSEASSVAGALDARAFTRAGEIYLPDSHGPLTGQKAQSLLAHEMTHVTQQRKFGSALPHEDSPVGRQLEAQAVAAETSRELPLAAPPEKPPNRTTPEVPPPKPAAVSLPGSLDTHTPAVVPDNTQRASANDAKWKDPDDAFRAQLDSNEDYMFDRFERRLRYLLIHERERGGTLIDAL